MKSNTLYSLYFIKNSIRLFFVTLMFEYIVVLVWWQANPQNHTRTVWMPLIITAAYILFLYAVYHFRLKHEKITLTEDTLFYYKKRYLRAQIQFYPVEILNDKIRIIAFKAETDQTFLFSLFLQQKRYDAFKERLSLIEESNA